MRSPPPFRIWSRRRYTLSIVHETLRNVIFNFRVKSVRNCILSIQQEPRWIDIRFATRESVKKTRCYALELFDTNCIQRRHQNLRYLSCFSEIRLVIDGCLNRRTMLRLFHKRMAKLPSLSVPKVFSTCTFIF